MAKVQGPLFSFGASGTVAKILTINQSLAQPTARKKPTGYRPASPMQAIMREEFRQAAESWRNLSDSDKAEWIALAAPTAHPPFAKYFLEWQAQQSTPAIPPYIPMA
jgi:hypothetical protein